MRKIILTTMFLAAGMVSAANGSKGTDPSVKKNLTKKAETKTVCTVSCSTQVQIGMNTLTITSTAGSIFTSCETAATNCTKKLMSKVLDMAMNTNA
ncbi:MAG: hypothetical protein MUW56_18885 [Chryseobacterium sp.]|uniref:hypothetical protein n=1 Tax=Chryseobacterium sp. TaxID=1871047 RepID=UPI0025C16804|nr:hypothetical protein [Chryseobacterium sp.]MCJ7935628.1 hypothetical protein [Chryseobacterium sp.]